MQVAQLLVNGLMAGAILALPAIAFSLVYAVLQVPNFSVAATIAVGAYASYVANTLLGLPALPAIVVAFIVAGAVGVVSDYLALRPLRRRAQGPLSVAIASIALYMVLENILRFVFGNNMRALDIPVRRDWIFWDIHLGPQQLLNFIVAILAMGALFGLLAWTRLGRAMRAVADNPQLADIKGVDPERISQLAIFIGMGLAGIAGMLIALDTAIDPTIGFRVILSVFAAAVLGGLGSIPGAALGGLIIGVAEEMSVLAIPVAYRTAVGFIAIVIALLFFPRGILGNR